MWRRFPWPSQPFESVTPIVTGQDAPEQPMSAVLHLCISREPPNLRYSLLLPFVPCSRQTVFNEFDRPLPQNLPPQTLPALSSLGDLPIHSFSTTAKVDYPLRRHHPFCNPSATLLPARRESALVSSQNALSPPPCDSGAGHCRFERRCLLAPPARSPAVPRSPARPPLVLRSPARPPPWT